MTKLGAQLLGPVEDLLKEKIYWIPSGPLLAFPLDALRINGRYMIEQHKVVNLLSFPQNIDPFKSLQSGPLQSVFLAGNPQDYTGDYATHLDTSAEINAVADLFVGPGLQIIQGAALLPDEFQGGYFLDSSLVHLSMPGVINLQHPGDSGFELSESEYDPGRMVLRPQDIRKQKLSAALVFLSATRITQTSPAIFSSQPGLVSDFGTAGARSVISNLWANDSESNEQFITDFYQQLQGSGNVLDSLHKSRLRYLKADSGSNLYDWAGYQLFVQ
jgi:CHAT domain-containing protein